MGKASNRKRRSSARVHRSNVKLLVSEGKTHSDALRLLQRLRTFKITNQLLFSVCTGVTVYQVVTASDLVEHRLQALPSWAFNLFFAIWAVISVHRLLYARKINRTLAELTNDYIATLKYYRFQVVSSLLTLTLYVLMATYVSGALESAAIFVGRFVPQVKPLWIESALAIVVALFWSVLGNPIWDAIKWSYRRIAQKTRRKS